MKTRNPNGAACRVCVAAEARNDYLTSSSPGGAGGRARESSDGPAVDPHQPGAQHVLAAAIVHGVGTGGGTLDELAAGGTFAAASVGGTDMDLPRIRVGRGISRPIARCMFIDTRTGRPCITQPGNG
jgi:hypothetical protein